MVLSLCTAKKLKQNACIDKLDDIDHSEKTLVHVYDVGITCFINEGCVSVSLQIKTYEGHFEIVSLVGTLSSGGHLHMSISDAEGNVFGGHVFGDVIVYTTAEVIVGNCPGAVMNREEDKRTGYKELTVQSKP